jgi:hypothetical protein
MSTTWNGDQAAFHSYEEVAGPRGRRAPRDVAGGEGTLTPDRTFVWQGVTYTKNVTRVAPDHPVTRTEHAVHLVPTYAREASWPIIQFLERQLRERSGERRGRVFPKRSRSTSTSWRLGSPGWKLGH